MANHKLTLQTVFFLLFFVCVVGDDSAYMLKLLEAITPTPPGWSNETHICDWSGVGCIFGSGSGSGSDVYVTTINLDSKKLSGILPSDLNSLNSLSYLFLRDNSFTGPLPFLANLNSLTHVDLSYNNFTSIPDGCFQGLTNLNTLSLRSNHHLAPWMVPTHLTHSSQLKSLDIVATNAMGSLQDIFDFFPSLEGLFASNNNITGVLPKSFAAASSISKLWLKNQRHRLSGTIDVLSSMTNLTQARLQGNQFTGSIPDLSNCPELYDIELADNQLTGVIPPSLMNLSQLHIVTLEGNLLQGPVPVFKSTVFNVTLGVNEYNRFCRADPGPCSQGVTTLLEIAAAFEYPILLAKSWVGNDPCKDWSYVVCAGGMIQAVNLANLNLTGTISAAFANLTDLRHLYLNGNNLRGPIPQSLTTLPKLEIVDVSYNNLSGEVPKFSPKVNFTATGNDLLGRSKAAGGNGTSHSASKTSMPSVWVPVASIGGAGVIAIFIVIICNRKRFFSLVQKMTVCKKTRTLLDQSVEDFIKCCGSLTPKQYSHSEVKRITNSFREKLGQGGYGVVYKASLTDGRQVAVKVISEFKGSGEEFINEVASISRTSHVNIVSLLGFCYEVNKRALIYEFMPHGSLDKFLYKKGSPNVICNLDWNTLYHIAIGIARGLEYLHQGCNTRILHLDIKPQNILLDEDFCPKIADFGLAKICKMKESVVSILGTRGTPGYIAPEVFSRTYGGVSHKSDVYSYGMLIMEVIGGRKNYDSGGSQTSEMYFPDWIYKDLEQGHIPSRCLVNTDEENEMVMKITLVSLWCIQPNPSDRPSMSKVLEMLEGPLQSLSYPPKPILYSPERPPLHFSDISCSNIQETNSVTVE